MIAIYKRATNEVRTVIDPADNSQQERGIMRNDIVTLNFSRALPVPLAIGDYAIVFGSHYQVNRPVPFKKKAKRDVEYTLTLEGWQYDLKKAKYLFLNASNHFTELKFSLRGRPIDFMNLIVYNMERWQPGSGWTIGDVIDGDFLTIEFDNQNCLQVLGTLATQYKTEYLFEDKRMSLTKKAPASNVTLEYGQGEALVSIAQQNQDNGSDASMITRLYVYGSERNIGSNYRDGAKYLRMADSLYIEKNADVLGVFEDSVYFDDVYPRREGTVSAVGTTLQFTDAAIDFNVNIYKIPGVTVQVTFNTGLLAGSTFDVHEFDNATKTFTINQLQGDTTNLPTDALKTAVGDKYVLLGIEMPLSYVNAAEAELRQRGAAYLNENGPGKVVYPVESNDLYFKREGIELELGKTYRLISEAFNIDRNIRLVSYTRNLRKPEVYTLELADSVAVQSTIVKLINLT